MSQDKVYVHIKFDLNDDRVCFDDGEFKTIGRYLLDFIYFDFDADAESKDNEHLNRHPYFKLVEKSLWPVDKAKKLQRIYRAYFDSTDQEEKSSDETVSPLEKYRCIAAIRTYTEEGIQTVEYMVTELEDCLYLEWFEMRRRMLHVKLCKNCHRLFVPKKGNIDYCQRIFTDDNKTCAQVGYAQTFAKNVKNDELLQAYTRAYKAHYARMTKPRKRTANMTKEEFEAWYAQAKNYLSLARQGKINIPDYLEWLKK